MTDPDGPHLLTLPIDKVDNFKQQLTAIPVDNLLLGTTTKSKSVQDDSEDVASEFVAVAQAQIDHERRALSPKPTLTPRSLSLTARSPASAPMAKLVEPKKKATVHTVKNGDTLWTIARNYRVSVEELTRLNGLQRRQGLPSGKKFDHSGGDS
ncbi:MAG: LysM peptidoglycan-binding domain-containing protein [Thiotrichaceae bacterium]